MFNKEYWVFKKIYLFIIVLIFIVSLYTIVGLGVMEKEDRYVLVYDNLYNYGEKHSQVLSLYIKLKSIYNNVLLVKSNQIKDMEFKGEDIIIAPNIGFDSEDEYNDILQYCREKGLKTYKDEKGISKNKKISQELFIAVDKVYPFSDLNKLMDTAESLNNKGINFICVIMPIYQNYEIAAYKKFIEVLKYVEEMGGRFFIHYPIFNEEGTYNLDSREGFKRSIEEYRKNGINILGIRISRDKIFKNRDVFEGLNLPFLLVTEEEGKLQETTNLFKISKEINNHIFIDGKNMNKLNIFTYTKQENVSYNEIAYIDINTDITNLYDFLKILYSEEIPIEDFNLENYYSELKNFDFDENVSNPQENQKNELEEFREREMKKIKGENLEEEQSEIENYDISKAVRIVIKILLFIILILAIQVFIGRKYDIRKFFKK